MKTKTSLKKNSFTSIPSVRLSSNLIHSNNIRKERSVK